ncbi:MAG: BLUF domain-containing protein [SAR324 cluster bacterium]|nr:BLUF domain-containing protein [SAR324 cluster bacterium]
MSDYRLIYVSKRDESLNLQEILDIIESSEMHNKEDHLTGMLLYSKNAFMQVLEGDLLQINQTYQRICKDPRHSDIILLSFQMIEHRMFSDWLMKLYDVLQMKMDDRIFDLSEQSPYYPFPINSDSAFEILMMAKYVSQGNV